MERRNPAKTKWYLADIVMHHKLDGSRRSVVHVNSVLVRAGSIDDAYTEAIKLGRDGEFKEKNEKGKFVRTRFRGLAGLYEIYDKLEHGGEIIFSQHVDWPEGKIKKLLLPKRELTGFVPGENPIPGFLDYLSGDLAGKMR